MPKPHRTVSGGFRSHSRSSSNTKLNANLYFTQKEPNPSKAADKPNKKNNHQHGPHTVHVKSIARVSSTQRVHSRDPVPSQTPATPTVAPKHTSHQRNCTTKSRPGFTIASPNDDDEDEEEWLSTESGVATPDDQQSNSDGGSLSDSNTGAASSQFPVNNKSPRLEPSSNNGYDGARIEGQGFHRVETARPSDFASVAVVATAVPSPSDCTQTLTSTKTEHGSHPQRSQTHPSQMHNGDRPSSSHASPRHLKRLSSTRPPSTHSIKGDSALRPHPLIRGHSSSHIYPAKRAPLEPLTVTQDTSLSASPEDHYHPLSTSPTSSIKTTLTSPSSPEHGVPYHQRRTSVSSVSTLPTPSTLRDSVNWTMSDRKRTMSSLSHSSSSAALSSLAHLPTITRPPSPQAISFFPPVNPHANIEGIHPLLPSPYLHNHLTVLARRTPIKESFDRVVRAKQELRTSS